MCQVLLKEFMKAPSQADDGHLQERSDLGTLQNPPMDEANDTREPWRTELPGGVFIWGQTPLPWPRTKEELRVAQRLKEQAALADAGDFFLKKLRYALITSEEGWNRHYLWGYRVFTAWNRGRGIGIIVDREEPTLEQHSLDIHIFYQSGILILRLPYGDGKAISKLLARIARDGNTTWNERRQQLGTQGVSSADLDHVLEVINPHEHRSSLVPSGCSQFMRVLTCEAGTRTSSAGRCVPWHKSPSAV